MSTDASKVKRIQRRLAALSFNRFFPHVHYIYAYALVHLSLHTSRMGWRQLEAIFPIRVELGTKFCLSILESIGIPEIFLCSVSALQLEIIRLPAAPQLLVCL
jgi:hypothetical protein